MKRIDLNRERTGDQTKSHACSTICVTQAFTLVEVLAALLLLTVVSLIVLSLVLGSTQINALSQDKREALHVALAIVEAYRKLSAEDLNDEFQSPSPACADAPDPTSGWHVPPEPRLNGIPDRLLFRYSVCVKLEKPYRNNTDAPLYKLAVRVKGPMGEVTHEALVGGRR
ncbi:prepilin-type N-terminal cleavage/methylation domain-containing protein [Hydrogenibacillus sp. N12]|uniref:prepilin-type N-terminal cleavage/methylation domain-containing protein n=1 Tax=Hydrogenibacillus sp. N12 TaxID=2866627 RepID=UPI001C7E14D6|nr:prepilin-type N-terminal cleavage/methylation domain-containing protein [Hydrogenibacillus sp. N12]QZA32929.1 prepilin-type N-terminal cleavage/methylation domain-containing protein [Hydrogenibacillus sp. N12]